MPGQIDYNDPRYAESAAEIMRRHDSAEPEANITSAVRNFLTATGLVKDEEIVEENPPAQGSRRAVDPTALDTFVEFKRRIGITGGFNPNREYVQQIDPNREYVQQIDDYLAQSEKQGRVRMGILTDGRSEDGAGHPKKSSRVLCQGVAARYAMMKQLRLDYPTSVVSRMLVVSASGYYAWVDRPPSKRAREEVRLELEIKAAHKRTRQTYGPERLQRDLAEHGVRVGIGRIKRIRKKLGIRCKQKRRFKATTQSRHRLSVAENVLGQQFKVCRPNAVWVTDITYVPTDEGWLYLAGHKDLFTGEIVGYAMGERLSRNLVSQSLLRALSSKRPSAGVLHHSDRGSQYCSQEYRSLLERFGLQTSMSRTGNCFDNAPMESFWGTLKQELVHHRHYGSRREAVRDITEYVESFYNRQRRQARLGFLSPAAYEKRYYAGLLAA